MLPAEERLRKSSLFQRAYAAKKSVSHPLLSLYVLERQRHSTPRLPLVGFVIGKKMESKACLRNRAKRRVREAYRQLRLTLDRSEDGTAAAASQDKYNLKQWYAFVFVIRSEVVSANFSDVCQSVKECVEKAARKYGRKNVQR